MIRAGTIERGLRSQPEPTEPQNQSEDPQPMPLTDRDYYRGEHPAACTCVDCTRRLLGRPGSHRPRPIYHGGRKRRGFWGRIKQLGAGLFILAVLATAADIAYHWYNGAPLDSAFTMMTDDYRLLAACPTEVEAIRDFLQRPSQEDYLSMSDRYGDDWAEQTCNASASRQQAMPTPNIQATVTAGIEATVQALFPSTATALPAVAAAMPSPTHEPASASLPAATAPLPTSTPTPSPAPTSTPLPTATSTSTPPPTATPTSTTTPSPTAVVHPSERHIELKRYMLDLINDERAKDRVDPVVLGDNVAAQLHAESSLSNCHSGHWGIDGLKPYMRYSLAGGYQSNGENALGFDYCIPASGRFAALGSMEQEIRDGMEIWMGSSGHRRSILDPLYKKVNIGLAWDRYNFSAIQQFEGDYVEYDQLPTIENGTLTISGTVKNGASFADAFSPQIYYDRPPHTLTRGQLVRTHCYDTGLQIAALRRPPPPNWFYSVHEFTTSHQGCPDPYEVPSDASAPRPPTSPLLVPPSALRPPSPPASITAPYITASVWRVDSKGFSFSADLSDLLSKHGSGVYSIMIWGKVSGRTLVISQYSIFHGVTPPDTYDPGGYD